MIDLRRAAGAALAVSVLTLCTACSSSPAPATSAAPSNGTKSTASSGASPSSAAAAVNACALVSAADLAAVAGAKPDAGTPSKGKVDGGQCTWTFSKTHTAIAQVTHLPDQYLPAAMYAKPKGANAVAGADRGWANAASHTILVVKGSTGVFFSDIGFGVSGQGGQDTYDALAASIAAKL